MPLWVYSKTPMHCTYIPITPLSLSSIVLNSTHNFSNLSFLFRVIWTHLQSSSLLMVSRSSVKWVHLFSLVSPASPSARFPLPTSLLASSITFFTITTFLPFCPFFFFFFDTKRKLSHPWPASHQSHKILSHHSLISSPHPSLLLSLVSILCLFSFLVTPPLFPTPHPLILFVVSHCLGHCLLSLLS